MWYPTNEKELEIMLDKYLEGKPKYKKVNGLIVPHAGYLYSGEIAGMAYKELKKSKKKKAIILAPSHYQHLEGGMLPEFDFYNTPIGRISVFKEGDFERGDLSKEHSITNQIPFLIKLGFESVMPLMIGIVDFNKAEEIAEILAKIDAVYIVTTDLSHFLKYDIAEKTDKNSIDIIKKLDLYKFNEIDACGFYPLLVLFYLCKKKKMKPKLIHYDHSGNVTKDKAHGVVGYASFYF